MKRYILLICIIIICGISNAQETGLFGRITDSTGENVPCAAIGIVGTTVYTVANDKGEYRLSLDKGVHLLSVSAVGYKPYKKEILTNRNELFIQTFVLIINGRV